MDVTHARTATRHRIPRRVSRRIAQEATVWYETASDPKVAGKSPRYLCVGLDDQGREIELIVVAISETQIHVIHAMSFRQKTRDWIEDHR